MMGSFSNHIKLSSGQPVSDTTTYYNVNHNLGLVGATMVYTKGIYQNWADGHAQEIFWESGTNAAQYIVVPDPGNVAVYSRMDIYLDDINSQAVKLKTVTFADGGCPVNIEVDVYIFIFMNEIKRVGVKE